MGACCGPQDETDREVQKELDLDRRKDKLTHKLLLLGAGGSGKSTFFKQLKNIHGDGHGKREIDGFRRQVYGQLIISMQTLIKQCKILTSNDSNNENDSNINEIDMERRDNLKNNMNENELKEYIIEDKFNKNTSYILDLGSGCAEMNSQICDNLLILWNNCSAIKKMYEFRNKICVPDSTSHFMNNLKDRISKPDYTPTKQDILLVRYRTTGMNEKTFTINDASFNICDVGGQRSERKKWIKFFDNVTAVLFTVSLSCYDEVPFEDVSDLDADLATANNMLESLKVWEKTLNEHVFELTGFILFLNKRDLFEEKIKRVNITTAFPNYNGKQEFGAAAEYIKYEFVSKNTNEKREIFSHITTATDSNNVKKVFNDVQQCVVNWSLQIAGLV